MNHKKDMEDFINKVCKMCDAKSIQMIEEGKKGSSAEQIASLIYSTTIMNIYIYAKMILDTSLAQKTTERE